MSKSSPVRNPGGMLKVRGDETNDQMNIDQNNAKTELKHWAFGHHTSWRSLQESKDSNCPICERLHCDEKSDFQEVLSFVSVITFSNIMQKDAPYANKDTILMHVFCGFTNYPVYLCATSGMSTTDS